MSARPRGGDWLEDELAAWRGVEIDTVLSLLAPEEERDLDLGKEGQEVKHCGMKFLSLPIPDRQVPASQMEVNAALEKMDSDLSAGKNVVIHCRQGIGRSGLIAACLLITKGFSAGAAIDALTATRGVPIPETAEQRRWIDQFAASFAGAK